ncbi:MAG: hypothetical protein A2Y82_02755 [Candidatus Buchananbacteria bacterium RBG_13_36_9]|uniref:Glycerophosphoryl diester phosphodiesterase membrane domain-containing protein n=1 Tax=Candidatus Buchananbacteria bacterium RBG_13_36_9 TaxID=1797530 RepID=A0A1G1XP66_9BACT|nr:MAG: hypothetical protein A2Y82_02755 [Candidatus Buchananbacteria bacterium RBG_13_36_9]
MGATNLINRLYLGQLFVTAFQIIKKTWKNLLKIILLILAIILLVSSLIYFIWQFLLSWQAISIPLLFYLRIFLNILIYIAYFLIATIAQILLIQQLLSPQTKFKEIVSFTKKYFPHFLCLTIILNLLILTFTLPIYIGFFLIILKSYILGGAAIILGTTLLLFFAIYLVFSPFLLLEKNLSCWQAIKKSLKLTEGYFVDILSKIVILALIIIFLNLLSVYLLAIPYIGLVLSAFIIILMIIFSFAYLTAMYQNFIANKNVPANNPQTI